MKLFREYVEDYQKAIANAPAGDEKVMKMHVYIVNEFLKDIGILGVTVNMDDRIDKLSEIYDRMPIDEAVLFDQVFDYYMAEDIRKIRRSLNEFYYPLPKKERVAKE